VSQQAGDPGAGVVDRSSSRFGAVLLLLGAPAPGFSG